jgi:hypothetical protein
MSAGPRTGGGDGGYLLRACLPIEGAGS